MGDQLEEVKWDKKVFSMTVYTCREEAHKQNQAWIIKYLLNNQLWLTAFALGMMHSYQMLLMRKV